MHLRHSLVVSLSVPLAPETSLEDVAKFIVLCCDCAGRRACWYFQVPLRFIRRKSLWFCASTTPARTIHSGLTWGFDTTCLPNPRFHSFKELIDVSTDQSHLLALSSCVLMCLVTSSCVQK